MGAEVAPLLQSCAVSQALIPETVANPSQAGPVTCPVCLYASVPV